MAIVKLPQTVRISNQRTFGATSLAFHPNERYGICVRAQRDGIFLQWNGGYSKITRQEISTASWFVPKDHLDLILPVKMRRPRLSVLLGLFVVKVSFGPGLLEDQEAQQP
jgi:hypothetical protein